MLDRIYPIVWQDGRIASGTKSVAYWMIVKNFDFGANTFHKGKRDGVSNRGGKKQVTTVGIGNKRGGEGGINNRAKEGKRQTTIAIATKGIIAVAARK